MKKRNSTTKKDLQPASTVPEQEVDDLKIVDTVGKHMPAQEEPRPEPVGDTMSFMPGSFKATLILEPPIALEFSFAVENGLPLEHLELSVDRDLLPSIFKHATIEIESCGASCESKVAFYDHIERKLYIPVPRTPKPTGKS